MRKIKFQNKLFLAILITLTVIPIIYAISVILSQPNHTSQEIVNSGGRVFNNQGQAYFCDSLSEPTSSSDIIDTVNHPLQQFSKNSTNSESIDSNNNGWPDVGVTILSTETQNIANLSSTITSCNPSVTNCIQSTDGSTSTFLYTGCQEDSLPVCQFAYQVSINFSAPAGNINKIEVIHKAVGAGAVNYTVEFYYNGNWNQVFYNITGAGYPSFNSGIVTQTKEGNWYNVEKARVKVYGFGVYSSSIMTAVMQHSVYEIKIFSSASSVIQPQAISLYHDISQIKRGVAGAENKKIDSNGNGWPDKCDAVTTTEVNHYWEYGEVITCGAGTPPACPSFTPDCSANLGQECPTPGQTTGPCDLVGVQMTAGPGSLGFCKCATLICV